jgi:antitoxin component of MazEF toxin-antitoxin module
MVKTITKVGNSHGIILDAALLEMTRLRAGDEVNIEVHEGGTITITPLRPAPSREQAAAVVRGVMTDYADTMKKLS